MARSQISENRITYTIAVTNNGPDAVGGVVMTDNVAGFVGNVADAVPDTTAVGVSDDSGGRFNCTTGATVTCTLANGQTMANGETVTFTLTADRPLLDGTINNTASVTSTELGDNNRLNNSASATVDVDPLGDIELSSKVVTPNTVPAGTQATYVITVINNGPSASNNVQVSDVFAPPPGRSFTFVSSGPSKGSCAAFAANTLNCDLGTLSKDETATVTVVVRPDWDVQNDAWTLPNTATVTTTSPDTNAVNNSQTANLPVTPAVVDLLVNKTDLRDPTPFDPTNLPGNVIVYRVNMTNRGPSLATNVVLTRCVLAQERQTTDLPVRRRRRRELRGGHFPVQQHRDCGDRAGHAQFELRDSRHERQPDRGAASVLPCRQSARRQRRHP